MSDLEFLDLTINKKSWNKEEVKRLMEMAQDQVINRLLDDLDNLLGTHHPLYKKWEKLVKK